MSKSIVGETDYDCGGCQIGPNCPGHHMRVFMDCSTDVYIVEVDGKRYDTYHEEFMHALMNCIEKKNG